LIDNGTREYVIVNGKVLKFQLNMAEYKIIKAMSD